MEAKEPPAKERWKFYFGRAPDESHRAWVTEQVTGSVFFGIIFFQALALAALVMGLSLAIESDVNWAVYSLVGLGIGFLIRVGLWLRDREREMQRFERTWAGRRKLAEKTKKKSP